MLVVGRVKGGRGRRDANAAALVSDLLSRCQGRGTLNGVICRKGVDWGVEREENYDHCSKFVNFLKLEILCQLAAQIYTKVSNLVLDRFKSVNPGYLKSYQLPFIR